jgi:hypothetical protein
MDVEFFRTSKKILRGTEGQSLLEFFILFPVFLAIFIMMLRTNSATQVSINNQRYSRAIALHYTMNDPWLVMKGRDPTKGIFGAVNKTKYHRLVLGVGDDEASLNGNQPAATTLMVTRNAGTNGQTKDTAPQTEQAERAFVRVRNTVTLCLPLSFTDRKQSFVANFGSETRLTENYAAAGKNGEICGGPDVL